MRLAEAAYRAGIAFLILTRAAVAQGEAQRDRSLFVEDDLNSAMELVWNEFLHENEHETLNVLVRGLTASDASAMEKVCALLKGLLLPEDRFAATPPAP